MKDFGVKLILVPNNDAVIYTDPYLTSSNWRTEIQSNLTSVIGEANYDMGHLFGTSAGNLGDAGCRGCICTDNSKGSGYTAASPINFSGDTFDIEVVAHEMGHQLGASHTFTHKIDNNTSQIA